MPINQISTSYTDWKSNIFQSHYRYKSPYKLLSFRNFLKTLLCIFSGFNLRLWIQVLYCNDYFCYGCNSNRPNDANTTKISICSTSMQNYKCKPCFKCSYGDFNLEKHYESDIFRYKRGILETVSDIPPPPISQEIFLRVKKKIKSKQIINKSYQYFNDYYLYDKFENEPKVALTGYYKQMNSILLEMVMRKINKLEKWHKNWELQKILNGYLLHEDGYGTEYILDLRIRHKNDKKRLIFDTIRVELFQALGDTHIISLLEFVETNQKYPRPFNLLESSEHIEKVHIILPLAGGKDIQRRFSTFLLDQYRKIGRLNVKLYVVLFIEDTSNEVELELNLMMRDFLDKYNSVIVGKQLNSFEIEIIPMGGKFTRGGALHKGANELNDLKSLMFFCDADMVLTPQFLTRCRENTQLGSSVYYPVVFSQFNPDFVKNYTRNEKYYQNLELINKYTGHWVTYGFGLVCLYKQDYLSVGGFNLNITGWGAEDVDLYEKHVKSDLKVFRSMDPDLLHLYHKKYCDFKLNDEQYNMCIDTKSESHGSKEQLSQKILYDSLSLLDKKNLKPFNRTNKFKNLYNKTRKGEKQYHWKTGMTNNKKQKEVAASHKNDLTKKNVKFKKGFSKIVKHNEFHRPNIRSFQNIYLEKNRNKKRGLRRKNKANL
ncbi:unnamed protein product [Gordionus sp. m RMFG-2023]